MKVEEAMTPLEKEMSKLIGRFCSAAWADLTSHDTCGRRVYAADLIDEGKALLKKAEESK